MGCADANCEADEEPQHTVTLGRFAIDRFEVTVSAYDACVGDGACVAAATGNECNAGDPGYEEHPINCVDWDQATAYCEWAGKQLPTEAQWEKAARGLDSRPFPWGDEIPSCALCVMVTNGWGCGTGRTDRVVAGDRSAGAGIVRRSYDPWRIVSVWPAGEPASWQSHICRPDDLVGGARVSVRR
jgi:iron(II)-dependent oxidoreductase